MSQSTSGPTIALESRDVRKCFGATKAIRGVNPTIGKGERHALIGPNGAGKSTMFNLVLGHFPASSGSVRLNGEGISGLVPFEISRKGLSRSFQVTNIFHCLSVFGSLCCAMLRSFGYKHSFWHGLIELRNVRECTEEILEQIGMTYWREAAADLLTYAEQRALETGIIIAGGADVTLLDEPTAGMSRSESDHMVELTRRVIVGKTLVMVEHDMSVMLGLADRISVLIYGEVVATDTPEAIHNNRRVEETYLGTTLDEPAGTH